MILKQFRPLFASFLFFLLLLFPLSFSSAQSERPLLNVDRLVEEALQNNPEILAAKARWEVYKEKVPQASALEDPMFGFGIVNLPTNFSFREEDMTMKEFSLSQKLPFPGKETPDEGDGREGSRGRFDGDSG